MLTEAAPGRPSVLLVTIDTLRADHVGVYGHTAARTPTMDRLAAEGTLFRTAVTQAVVTGPSHASILTGLIPGNHGVLTWGRDLELAYLRMELIEHLARIALAAQPLGGVQALPHEVLRPLLEARARALELEAAEARIKASEERKARRLTVALAPAVVLAVLAGAAGYLWVDGETRERLAHRDRTREIRLPA